MILDNLDNFHAYTSVHAGFPAVASFLQTKPLHLLDLGRHDISKDAFVLVSEYDTKDYAAGVIECHKRYIDIQTVLTGKESIGYCAKAGCVEHPFDESRDFQRLEGSCDFFTLKPGLFSVFFPQDGHMPGIKIGTNSERVRKIVFKISVVPGS